MLFRSLIVNGSGYAFASANMPMSMAKVGLDGRTPSGSNSNASASSVQPPCHQPADTKSSADTQRTGSGTHANDPSEAVDQDAPDCCKSADCRCACVHQMPVFVAVDWVRDAVIVHTDHTRSMTSAHTPPILPHLIRPPIG